MTSIEFNLLDTCYKMAVVNQFGDLLNSSYSDKKYCNCYAVDTFFVEVIYGSRNYIISGIKAFKNAYELDIYSDVSL